MVGSRREEDSSHHYGRLVPGTNCDYKLTNCSRRACTVRSPNYPGLYQRNLTCSHHIYVLPAEVPPGRVAVIAVGGGVQTPSVRGMRTFVAVGAGFFL